MRFRCTSFEFRESLMQQDFNGNEYLDTKTNTSANPFFFHPDQGIFQGHQLEGLTG